MFGWPEEAEPETGQEITQDDGKSKYYSKQNTKGRGGAGEVKSGDRTSSLGVDWVLEEPERGSLEEVSLPLQTRGGERKREHHEGHVSLNNEETQSGRLSENPGVYLGRAKPSMGVCMANKGHFQEGGATEGFGDKNEELYQTF